MSEALHSAENARAKDIEERASKWVIERHTSDHWSADDQAQLNIWLNESLAHAIAFWRLNHGWDRTYRLGALRGAGSARGGGWRSRLGWRALIGIAAVILVIAGLGGGAAFLLSHETYTTYATDIGGRKILSLSDGSKIELNTDTSLRIAKGSGGRHVWLDKGEAYFEINHNAAWPFVVTAGTHRVTDLGTKFTMHETGNRLEVALLEGSAQLQSIDPSARQYAKTLVPGDIAIASVDTMTVRKVSEQGLTDRLAWQRSVLVFRHVTLADVAAEFNRYNREKIIVTDPVAAKLEIVGAFPANDLELFGRAAHRVLGVRVQTRGNALEISK